MGWRAGCLWTGMTVEEVCGFTEELPGDSLIQPRRLAAVDVFLLGPTLVIVEFAAAVIIGVGLGTFICAHAHSLGQELFGGYIALLGMNYAPMLWHALHIKTRKRAKSEIEDELDQRGTMAAKYRRQSLYLLIPFVTPIVAFRDFLVGR